MGLGAFWLPDHRDRTFFTSVLTESTLNFLNTYLRRRLLEAPLIKAAPD